MRVGCPPPGAARISVMRLLPVVLPPDVTMDSIQFMTKFFGRVAGYMFWVMY